MSDAYRERVPTAYVVDDDESARTLWRWLMESNGIAVKTFATAAEFIDACPPEAAGCLVLDLRLPGMSCLELQEYLKQKGVAIPTLIVTGHGDIPTAVSVIKGGALDFIQKPFSYREVLAVIQGAFRRDAETRGTRMQRAEVSGRLAALTDRERDVLRRVIEGKPNKIIANELDISVKTVEFHRSRMMEKMGAGSVAGLVQLALGFTLMEASRPDG